MKTTRRIFSMVLALMMVLSLSVTAFAGNTVDVSDKYMNQYTIQNGDVIELSLATTSMTWTATDPIQAEYPYC